VKQSFVESVPLITDGNFKILGNSISLVQYLKNAYPHIRLELYSEDVKEQVDKYFGWF
jgi:hypothetical protein